MKERIDEYDMAKKMMSILKVVTNHYLMNS
jgi:hypothetical protein